MKMNRYSFFFFYLGSKPEDICFISKYGKTTAWTDIKRTLKGSVEYHRVMNQCFTKTAILIGTIHNHSLLIID